MIVDNRFSDSPITIYALVDCVGTVRYVGQTIDPRRRVRVHRQTKSWVSGWIALEVVPPGGDWRAAERRHIEEWNRWGDLENIRSGGQGGHTPETRAKLSAAKMGRPRSLETRAKLSAAHIGKVLPAETRAKMSAANMGKTLTPSHRAKIRAALLGHPVSPETRAKISASNGARTPAARAKMSVARRGKTLSPETRAKISSANRIRWSKPAIGQMTMTLAEAGQRG